MSQNAMGCGKLGKLGLAIGVALWLLAAPAAAETGQEDLDRAVERQLTARTLEDLDKVAELCESALTKGLDPDNTELARQLLSAALYQHASQVAEAILDQQPPHPRWQALRQWALENLEKAIRHRQQFADAQLLVARLQALPGGDREKALQAADEAVGLLQQDDQQQAKALVLRGQLTEDAEQKLADFHRAIELDPGNIEGWQARALHYLQRGQFEQAEADLKRLLKEDTQNVMVHLALGETLANLGKYDQALEQATQAIELQDQASAPYALRARIRLEQNEPAAALEDLEQALKLEPRNAGALLLRARILLSEDQVDLAKTDVERLLQLRPGLGEAVLLRSLIAASEQDFSRAIDDLQQVLRQAPQNVGLRVQLARYYSADQRPRRGIQVVSELLDQDPDNALARQARGDMLLSVGQHTEAIADYEVALKQQAEDSGLLNNLAWVLATSPEDDLRDGQRAIELARKACELTQFQRPHILSTLAAGYAETGDFETAIEWSTKAIELSQGELVEQLREELESYQQKKPYRERQETEERIEAAVAPET